jgi:FkbM family methyltransferase
MLRSHVEGALCSARLYRPTRTVYQRLRRNHFDERHATRRLLSGLVPHRGLVFDVGANRGEMTATFLELGARVVAVEPTPELAALVERRYRSKRLAVEACAIGAEPGTATLHLGSYDEHSTLSDEWKELVPDRWAGSIEVPVRTLDQLIADHGVPEFVKIDVEGYELQVLQGLSQRVPALSFEFRSDMTSPALECMGALLELGPYRFGFAPLTTWTDPAGIMEALLPLGDGTSGDIYAQAA